MNDLIPQEIIESKILLLRGKKVMLDRDLAALYGVETKALNQAVRRNKDDFNYVPFAQEGGIGKAYQLFGEQLWPLLDEMNEALAA